MTKFLASVRNRTEALVALDNGADIIDVKEPDAGALGAADSAVLADIVAAVAGRRPVSAVAGTLPMAPADLRQALDTRRNADFIKLGFPGQPGTALDAGLGAVAPLARGARLVAVLFAEDGFDHTLPARFAAAGLAGIMLDTGRKDGKRLLDHATLPALGAFVEAAQGCGLLCGLAGALEAPDIPRLLPLAPDYLGFRGALTGAERGDAVDGAAVARIARLVQPARASFDGTVDRVFMRDFVQDMEIGAYGFERGRRQRVRFSIEADVQRSMNGPQDLGDIYSYDLMMDAVRSIVARGHTDLVETLAEELADTLLQDRRLVGVVVRVEKLDLGPAAAGIEIRRSRPG